MKDELSPAYEDDLLRQRRNILLASAALWFLTVTGAEITDIALLGNKVTLEEPVTPSVWVCGLLVYFVGRFLIHMQHYTGLTITRAFKADRRRRFEAAALDWLKRERSADVSQAVIGRLQDRERGTITNSDGVEALKLPEGWEALANSGREELPVTMVERDDPEGPAVDLVIPAEVSARLFWKAVRQSALWTPYSVDFILPADVGLVSIAVYPLMMLIVGS